LLQIDKTAESSDDSDNKDEEESSSEDENPVDPEVQKKVVDLFVELGVGDEETIRETCKDAEWDLDATWEALIENGVVDREMLGAISEEEPEDLEESSTESEEDSEEEKLIADFLEESESDE